MHFSDITHLIAGSLQLVVAWYALRLGRILGVPRTGVSLFGAFSLLSMAYLSLSFGPFFGGIEWSTKADTVYALISAIMVVAMARLKYLCDQQLHGKKTKQHQLQTELETKIVTLTQAVEDWPKAYQELEQHVARLHAEIAEQKSAAVKLTDSNQELGLANEQLRKANEQLLLAQKQSQQSAAALQEELSQQKMLLDAVAQAAADHEAAMPAPAPAPEAYTPDQGDLPRINDLLSGVDRSIGHVARHLTESAVPHVSRIARLMRDHSRKIGEFMTRDPRGRQLPNSLAQLAQRLADEHSLLVNSLDAVKLKVERLRKITAPASVPVNSAAAEEFQFTRPAESTGFSNADYALQTGQTETGTTFEVPDVLGANLIPISDITAPEPAPELLPEETVSEAPAEGPSGTSETQTV